MSPDRHTDLRVGPEEAAPVGRGPSTDISAARPHSPPAEKPCRIRQHDQRNRGGDAVCAYSAAPHQYRRRAHQQQVKTNLLNPADLRSGRQRSLRAAEQEADPWSPQRDARLSIRKSVFTLTRPRKSGPRTRRWPPVREEEVVPLDGRAGQSAGRKLAVLARIRDRSPIGHVTMSSTLRPRFRIGMSITGHAPSSSCLNAKRAATPGSCVGRQGT